MCSLKLANTFNTNSVFPHTSESPIQHLTKKNMDCLCCMDDKRFWEAEEDKFKLTNREIQKHPIKETHNHRYTEIQKYSHTDCFGVWLTGEAEEEPIQADQSITQFPRKALVQKASKDFKLCLFQLFHFHFIVLKQNFVKAECVWQRPSMCISICDMWYLELITSG